MSPIDGLQVDQLTIAFGGNVAVQEASLRAPVGTVTGLIGPNGAGKTSTFNACSGLVVPTKGTVHLFGRDVTRTNAAARARAGLGRTFQRIEMVGAMSVRANVALSAEARRAGGNPFRQVFIGASARRAIDDATENAIELCDLTGLADSPASTLTMGQKRLLELARVIAGGYRLLMLDEPSSGLDETETRAFGQILQRVVADGTVGILLVEHDMSLVMSVCSHLFVLDYGAMIFDGSPAEAAQSADVRAAYLGEVDTDRAVTNGAAT